MIHVPPASTRPVRRTLDGARLTVVVNDPEVRPTIGGDGALDLTPLIQDPLNVCFETDHGGILCLALGSGRYDVHSLFLPEGRGAEAFDAMQAVADYMFSATDCTEGRTTVPCAHRPAAFAARKAGFESRFTIAIPWTGGTPVTAEFFALPIERWALKSPTTAPLGAWFHTQLADAKAAAGSPLPTHADDPVHDAIVGAVVLMVQAGNPEKAVRFYNVWAGCTQYAPIVLVRTRPIVLDVQDALVEASAGGFEVLRCR
ncbi:MAG TPA: hypothetical protein VKR23_15890 [Gaiellaceae bacterium]|nr:hypothetical protein [Gaiellaceae bacterium]